LSSPFCYIPHDTVVPGAISTGDLPVLAEVLGSEKLRLVGLVDGLNRRVDENSLYRSYRVGSADVIMGREERTARMLRLLR
jgi:hypothetical protein